MEPGDGGIEGPAGEHVEHRLPVVAPFRLVQRPVRPLSAPPSRYLPPLSRSDPTKPGRGRCAAGIADTAGERLPIGHCGAHRSASGGRNLR